MSRCADRPCVTLLGAESARDASSLGATSSGGGGGGTCGATAGSTNREAALAEALSAFSFPGFAATALVAPRSTTVTNKTPAIRDFMLEVVREPETNKK